MAAYAISTMILLIVQQTNQIDKPNKYLPFALFTIIIQQMMKKSFDKRTINLQMITLQVMAKCTGVQH